MHKTILENIRLCKKFDLLGLATLNNVRNVVMHIIASLPQNSEESDALDQKSSICTASHSPETAANFCQRGSLSTHWTSDFD